MRCLAFLLALVSPFTLALTVDLEWDALPDGDVGWYEVGYGSTSRGYTEYVDIAAPATQGSIEAPDNGQTFIGVRALTADRDPVRTSQWSNEVVAGNLPPTNPANQLGLWATYEERSTDVALVGQWTFAGDDGSDDVGSFDMTEIGNPSYASTPAYIDGQIAELDGNDAFVNTDANFLYDNGATSAFTFTGWFYKDNLTKSEVFAINHNWVTNNVVFQLELQTDKDAKVRLRAGTTTDTYETTSANIFESGRWVFFAITYDDDDADAVEVYFDKTTDQSSLGNVISTTHSTGGTVPQHKGASTPCDSFFGVRNGSSHDSRDSYLVGDIADFRVYDTALTSTEIEAVRDDGVSNGVTAALSGASSTSSAGTVQALRSKILTGDSRTLSAGTLSASRTMALSGASAAGSVGAITLSRAVPLTGSASVFSAGALTALRSAGLTGQEAQALAGTVTPQIVEAVEVALTGESATSAAGVVGALRLAGLTGESVSFSTGTIASLRAAGLSGDEINALAGTLSTQVIGTVEVALSGAESTTAAGTLAALRSVVLTGDEAAMADGIIAAVRQAQISGASASASAGTPVAARSAALSGSSASFSAGTVVALRALGLTGAQINALAGTLSIPGVEPVIVALTGVAFSTLNGDLAASRSIDLAGVASAAQAGTPAASRSAAISGASMTASDGVLEALRAAALAGDQAQTLAGSLASSRSAGLTGAAVSTIAGSVWVPGLGWVQVTLYFDGVEYLAYHDGVPLVAWRYEE